MNCTGAFRETAQHGETPLDHLGVVESTHDDPHGGKNGGQVGVSLGHDDDAVPAEEEGEGGGVGEVEKEVGQEMKQLGRIMAH